MTDLHEAFFSALHLLASLDRELWTIIGVSLKTALISLLMSAPIALVTGYYLGSYRFSGRRILIWLLQTCLAVPTVFIGLLLYLLLSRQGFLGGWHWLFTSNALIIGQVLIALPILISVVMTAVQAADPRIAETAFTLGATRWQVMLTVLRELRFAVLAALIHGYSRVISEVGCAMMVGGNIAGETRTMTTAIALETSKGEFAQGIALGLVLLLIALLTNALLMLLQGEAGSTGNLGSTMNRRLS